MYDGDYWKRWGIHRGKMGKRLTLWIGGLTGSHHVIVKSHYDYI